MIRTRPNTRAVGLLRLVLVCTFAAAVSAQEADPAGTVANAPAANATEAPSGFDLAARRDAHWAWQPLAEATPPAVPDAVHPVDAFVRARLAAAGLSPSPPASPHVQLRRLWFDLVGLPPPPDRVARFVAEPNDAAWDREVDDLLASPHFGERWARHWLDLVRYAESLGHEYDFPIPNAWRYRDYVIRAFNADVPFDVFVREHIAGDLLPEPRRDAQGNDESVQGTAAWWFAEQTHSPVDAAQHQADRIDNQIDVLGKAVLGLTVACARCHDHKFDAIGTADYYALFGFVKSSRYVQAPLRPLDVHGRDYGAALATQHAFATAWADCVRAAGGAPWAPFAASDPARWSGAAGIGPWRDGDEVIADVDGPRADWITTNDAFGPAPWRGPLCVDPAAAAPEPVLLPGAWWHSAAAGTRREGVLQTRTFSLSRRYVHVRAAGRASRVQIVVDGLNLVRDPIYGELHKAVDRAAPHWLTFDAEMWRGRPAHVQCLDQRAQDLADPDREREPYPEDAWLAVQAVVLSDHEEPPPSSNGMELPAPPWQQVPAAVRAAADALTAAQRALPVSDTLPALCDGTGTDEHVYLRGSHKTPGPLSPRRFLEALAGREPMAIAAGSGRLQLADAMLAPDVPLPARVLANRIWHHLFGRGIVRSVDNLGELGDRPSHPELLDWLARDLQRSGWSVKRMLRSLVRTATYRQDSRERPDAASTDPDNVLLHRQNVRRLEAEAVRDSLLAVAGALRPVLYGPPVPIPLDDVHEARGKPDRSGPLDGEGRRSIYLALHRNFLPPMLLAFDLPTPFATVGARNVSNVPAQALALLNDPFVHAMCATFAARLLRDGERPPAAIVDDAYLAAFARLPHAGEREHCLEFVRAAAAEHGAGLDDARPWTDLLHGLVNTKEFAFRR